MVQKLTYTQYGDYYIPDIRLHIWEYTVGLSNILDSDLGGRHPAERPHG